MSQYTAEVDTGNRFEFGKNWSYFLSILDDTRIQIAEKSLTGMIGTKNLAGKSFLDVGSGSGLFSLAARRLGAKVYSFDYDPESVACAKALKRRYFPNDCQWDIAEGSVLDAQYLQTLGMFDIVYSWGVLHHTGAMWQAIANAASLVSDKGILFIAIYNDQGFWSKSWKNIKRTYNCLPRMLKLPFVVLIMLPLELKSALYSLLIFQPQRYVKLWTNYKGVRGMSKWRDIIDWMGGYPFEVAKPEDVFDFLKKRGFTLQRLKTCAGGTGCNEFLFKKQGFDGVILPCEDIIL